MRFLRSHYIQTLISDPDEMTNYSSSLLLQMKLDISGIPVEYVL